ncbi:MAG: YciI family protein [Pseudomonadota bacterium]
MVAWTEYKAIAKERGALALELFVAVSTPQKAPDDVKSVLPEHLAYIQSLEVSGQLMMAGPLSDDTGEEMQGAGMLVLRAASMDEAHALAANDPMHSTGARAYTLRRWLVNEGSVRVSVGLSTGKADLR